jgi:hypothetical protein
MRILRDHSHTSDAAESRTSSKWSRPFRRFSPCTDRLLFSADVDLRAMDVPALGVGDVLVDSARGAERARACFAWGEVRALPEVGHAVLGQSAAIERLLSAHSGWAGGWATARCRRASGAATPNSSFDHACR